MALTQSPSKRGVAEPSHLYCSAVQLRPFADNALPPSCAVNPRSLSGVAASRSADSAASPPGPPCHTSPGRLPHALKRDEAFLSWKLSS